MQALLSFEQAPPISAPLRFFLTAPLFAMFAGVLLLYSGPELFVSRWTPAALALTHLMTVGFMLQVMLGAMQQLLPVVVGANFRQPLHLATLVHAAITPGALFLAAAFLTYEPLLFAGAALCLATGVVIFVVAAAFALHGIAATNPTVLGFKLSLLGLSVTALSGVLLAVALGLSLDLPLLQLADLHLGWGFMVWGCTLVAAVAFVAVPMFQITPEYPAWFSRSFTIIALAAVALWTLADLAGWSRPAALLSAVVVASAAMFSMVTLHILRRSKRAKRDASHHLWTVSMGSALVACVLWLATRLITAPDQWLGWPLLFGVLLLFGCFMTVILGMLYKIVPFLVWLHLQNRGRGRVSAPNMKKVLPQVRIDRQILVHFLACALLLLSVFWPRWFVYPAGLALIIAHGWLLCNLLHATTVYRHHLVIIERAIASNIEENGSNRGA
jgi:hypothetical protein